MELKDICSRFRLPGHFVSFDVITAGNINTTYLVTFEADDKHREYIVQKINKYVFKKPDLVMKNIMEISNFIIEKRSKAQQSCKRSVLKYMLTQDDISYYIDDNEDYWRCYRYIGDSLSVNSTNDLFVIEQAGIAFGSFQNALSDFDASTLYVSIQDFHNTKKRFDDFILAVNADSQNRVKEAKAEIDYLIENKDKASLLCNYLENGLLPLRVTHNDTKCNNVLFDSKTHEALAVIDLDTVMPGLTAYDYGDAVRSIASTAEEDEIDLSKVSLDKAKFEAFTKGFVREIGCSLTKTEKETLHMGILVITLELASRFLKDYLEGDIYFKVTHQKHNLERARCQIALAKAIEDNTDYIKSTINKYLD